MNTSASGQAAPASEFPTAKDFHPLGEETFEADLRVSEPDTTAERLQRLVLGTPIPEHLAGKEQLDRVRALAILSSDALSSVAYATEASLAVLVVAGASALSTNLGIGLVTAALMLIVGGSYQQTIHAYPTGGGSYIVARANIGTLVGLIAASALLVDYLLTVSVSVAAGIDAIASAVPLLAPITLWLDIGAIALLTLVNLRGLRSSGSVFALPTYFFLFSFGLMLAVGIVRAFLQGGPTAAIHPSAHMVSAFAGSGQSLSLLLILTAFAAGCSAMTGVEAISNGVPAFQGETPPQRANNAA
ncbi:MAG TPA: amino acid permease, partial [Ktedonobacterales bacterium]|nr:amino acid permease [Ktedonobacterales bacterium]